MSDKNRSERARMTAGLSIGQAAKLLSMDRDDLLRIERAEELDDDHVRKFSDLYCTRPEWITGEVSLRDYATVDKMKNADNLTPHDRDIIAEFSASMPRRKGS